MIGRSKFKSKKEFFAYLVKNREEIIAFKKNAFKFTEPFSFTTKEFFTTKANIPDEGATGSIDRTIVGNTYNWLDSHGDVHVKGIFSKSISENKNIMHLHDHVFELTAKVGTPKKVYEAEIKWTELGVAKEGKTTALFMDSEVKKAYNQIIFEDYLKGEIDQHSVGMQYVKMMLCIDDADYKQEFANWNSYFPLVANSDKATKAGYFWAVTEAKLREISCVIMGSNELTPTLDPSKDNHNIEPDLSTQTKKINYSNLLKHF